MHIQAPNDYSKYLKSRPSVFLAGSIEMGVAEDWQGEVVRELGYLDVLVLNPRRGDWDSSWVQDIGNPQFREQVEWELRALEDADIILLCLVAGTQSPISLLEFGIYVKSAPEKLVVYCPEGFWRKGNIDVTAAFYGVDVVDNKDEMIEVLKGRLLEMIGEL